MASTLDSLGKFNFRAQGAIHAQRMLDQSEDAEGHADMIQAVIRAQHSEDANAEAKVNSALIKRTENLAFAMEMAESGVTADEEAVGRETQERHRQKLRKDEELEAFRAAKKAERTTVQVTMHHEKAPVEKRKLPNFLKVKGTKEATEAAEAPVDKKPRTEESSSAGSATVASADPNVPVQADSSTQASSGSLGGLASYASDDESSSESE
eukprot:TRINITY_DN5864_c3_g1_i1.p1 TRINITY_DN5864_c3_g1~~TRINITY_DN5864_c3_g1_i1.p1  ORF type:complete len:210 (-),score=55.02 TRINITY_DN5864_c3_g1_i1:96-725(-)